MQVDRRTRHLAVAGAAGLSALLAALCLAGPAHTQAAGTEEAMSSPQAVVEELYDLVTFPAGTTPDWERVRSLFLPQAVIVLRTSRDASTIFSLDGFVDDFRAFIERDGVEQTGFTERIVASRSMVHGDIAHVLVLYEPSIPGSGRPPRQGVDSFQLVRRAEGWRIVSVVNELVTDEEPVPAELAGRR